MVHWNRTTQHHTQRPLSKEKTMNPNPIRKLGPIELSVSHPIAQFVLALGIPGGIFYLLIADRPVPDALWAALGSIIVFFFVNGRLERPD